MLFKNTLTNFIEQAKYYLFLSFDKIKVKIMSNVNEILIKVKGKQSKIKSRVSVKLLIS